MEVQNKIFVKRTFKCTRAELFEWLTDPARISQWFGPKHLIVGVVSSDSQRDGTYSIEMKRSKGESFFIEGKYLDLKNPDFLSFTFLYRGLINAPPESIVRIELKETETNEVAMTLTQEFITQPTDIQRRTESWEYMFGRLSVKLTQ